MFTEFGQLGDHLFYEMTTDESRALIYQDSLFPDSIHLT